MSATCAFCKKVFQPKDKRFATCCSRKCGRQYNLSRFRSGKLIRNGRTYEMECLDRLSRAVKVTQQKWKGRLRTCPMCLSVHLSLQSKKAFTTHVCLPCRNKTPSFNWTYICSPICVVCQKPREYLTTGGYARSGKRCVPCQVAFDRETKAEERNRRKARKRSNGNGSCGKGITIAKLAARDGDCCSICGDEVEWDSHYLSNWYPSIDHVVPLSKGGTHTFENTKLAHRWCNSVKGDGVLDLT